MHLASGGAAWDRVTEIVEHGQMIKNGFTGQLTQGEDLETGSYAFKAEFPTANARIGQGVHRDDIWTLNQQGDLAVHSGAHDDNNAVTDTYLYRRGYWLQGFDGARVTKDPPATEDGIPFERVRITPANGETVVLWINASTHLLDREQWGDAAIRYSDYRVVNGLKLPFSIRHVTNKHEDYAITLERIDVKDKVEDADVAIGFYHDFEMPASVFNRADRTRNDVRRPDQRQRPIQDVFRHELEQGVPSPHSVQPFDSPLDPLPTRRRQA